MILVFWPGRWERRLRALCCYGGLSSFPFILWLVWARWIVKEPSQLSTTGVGIARRLVESRVSIVNNLWEWLPFSSSLPDFHYRLKMLGLFALVGCVIAIALRDWLTRGAHWKEKEGG
jgi:ABC-type transport system involved in cytochrome c biogenesis permease subunit